MENQDRYQTSRRLFKIQERRKELLSEISRDNILMEFLVGRRDDVDLNEWSHTEKIIAPQRTVVSRNRHRHELFDFYFFDQIRDELRLIPDSNGSRFFEKMNVSIGIIADEFLFNSFKDVADFIYLTPDNYAQYSGKLDILLVVTTWRGLHEEWKGLGNIKRRDMRKKLYAIIDFFRAEGTRVVFYSKEDPPNYKVFIDIAKRCDDVLTTEKAKVKDYRRDCGHDRVAVMRFGVNPLYHNPIGIRTDLKRREVFFAGSWYRKYPERQSDTQMIFDGILESGYGLKIIDRNFYHENTKNYKFPAKYTKFISPSIPHEDLQKVHKLFNWAINLNSIKHSETMFANRVYELQALGNLVLSNFSSAINDIFPNVFLVHNKEEISDILNGMNDEEIYRHQVLGIRKVMSSETTFHRIEKMLNWLGMNTNFTSRKVAVLVEEINDSIARSFERQSYSERELLLQSEWKSSMQDQYDMVTFFHSDYEYDEFYLEDMINAFKYTACDYITKDGYFSGNKHEKGVEHDYVNQIKSKYRTVFWTEAFDVQELITATGPIFRDNGYSIDPFEFNVQPPHRLEPALITPQLSVIIPVHNNGERLFSKCFNSLKRSSIFERMEIILVDDGSTDDLTVKILSRLERHYSNVRVYHFPNRGSSDATRARIKEIEMATSAFIAFLDPHNEVMNDGYAKLVREIIRNDFDVVIGNMIMPNKEISLIDFYNYVISINGSDVITDTKRILAKAGEMDPPFQASIVKKDLVDDNQNLNTTVLGAMSFHQVFQHAGKIKVIDAVTHISYSNGHSSLNTEKE